jgi:predicted TIM-barrel fold metal-dependent hydrolase
MTININIEAIKELPLAEESIRKILYKNAAVILGLK